MNQAVAIMPTKLEIDTSMIETYKKIEEEKAKLVFGWKNWLGRHVKVIKALPKENGWEVAGVTTATLALASSIYLYGIGAYGNIATGSLTDVQLMGSWGHVPEWIFEAGLTVSVIWKITQQFQDRKKIDMVDQIYRKYLDSNKLDRWELNRLNQLRKKDLKELEGVCAFREKPFLPLASPLIVRQSGESDIPDIIVNAANN